MERLCFNCMRLTRNQICEHCGCNGNVTNAPHQLQPGTVLQGKYLVGRVLGQGGFGITYLGWNRYLQTRVAIKEFFPSLVVDRNATVNTSVNCKSQQMEEFFAENRRRFLREAQTLARLQEIPQIVSVYDFFEMNNTAYIVMEYLQGEDLRAYMRHRGVLSAGETFWILKPVMEALVKIHEAGLVHRDISPDNIMLLRNGGVKLMDFGSVRNVEHPDVEKDLTRATQAIVKQGFAPMEQYSETGPLGPWTDEYAICATIYYCLTGRVPENALSRILEGNDLDWNSVPGLTIHQKRVLEKGTAIRAKERYATMRELMADLFAEEKVTQMPGGMVVKPISTVTECQSTAVKPHIPKKSLKEHSAGKSGKIMMLMLAVLLVGIGFFVLKITNAKMTIVQASAVSGFDLVQERGILRFGDTYVIPVEKYKSSNSHIAVTYSKILSTNGRRAKGEIVAGYKKGKLYLEPGKQINNGYYYVVLTVGDQQLDIIFKYG